MRIIKSFFATLNKNRMRYRGFLLAYLLIAAIVAATISTISVFFPIVFTGGITRQLFTDLALTIAFSLLASLLIALTVVPAASSVMLKNVKNTGEGKYFTKFIDWYEKSLRFALRFKWAVIAFSIIAFVVSLWAIGRVGMEMFPAMEMSQIDVTASMPDGSTFDDTVEAAEALSTQVLAIQDVETVGVSIGGGMMQTIAAGMGFGGMGGMGGGTSINMYVILEEGRSITNDDLNAQIRDIGESLGLEMSFGGMDMAMLAGAPISIRVEGSDLDAIRDTAIALERLVATVDGAIILTDMTEEAAPEMRITVNKDVAMAYGLTVAQVFMAAMETISAPERSINMTLNGKNYEIVVSDGDFEAPDWAAIESIQFETAAGYVSLSEIATVHEDLGFSSINRINRNRFITITGEIEDGFNVGLVNNEIEALLTDFTTIGDSRVVIGGEAEALMDAFGDLLLMLALAVVFIYLIMVAQFQSLLAPFIIMFTIPLAFTGGFVSLMIVGMPLSIVAMIGLILLAGVATNTGIVFVSRINQMRWEGMAKVDAIIDAGRKRIRPILITAITTIFALSVMAIGVGEGTEMMQPMAIASIGGLLYGTIMTLYFVPALYDLLHRNKDITKEDLDSPDVN